MKIRELSVQQINAALNDLTRDIDIKIKQIESLNNEIKNMQSKLEALTKAVNGDFTALDEAIGDNIEYINNNFVPNTRTVNGKALDQNISLTASDVGALPDSTVIPAVVDSVTSGNMNPVTSNAVAGALNPLHIAKNGSIYADGTKANYPIIKMKDNTSDANGNGIVIGGGGATVIGGGESADTYYSGAGLSAGSETMVVANDGAIIFASNLQSNYASRKEMTMGTDGKLSNPQGFVGNVTGNCSGSSGSCTGNSASASRTLSRGNVTCETGTTVPAVSGVSMSQVYNNGYPTTYGNVITLAGTGHGQLLLGWSGTSGARANAYIRSKRDVSSSNWSDWYTLIDSGNIGSQTVNTANHIPTSKADDSPGAIWIA